MFYTALKYFVVFLVILSTGCVTATPIQDTIQGQVCLALEERAHTLMGSKMSDIDQAFRQDFQEGSAVRNGDQKTFLHSISDMLARCIPLIEKSKLYEGGAIGSKNIKKAIDSHYIAEESVILRSRTGNKKPCLNRYGNATSLFEVVVAFNRPAKECLYYNQGHELEALQIVNDQILIKVPGDPYLKRLALISRNNPTDDNVVDNDAIQQGYFIYSGVKQYKSWSGVKTLHSYSRLSTNPYNGLMFINGEER